MSALPLPLRGVRVVDASQLVAGPYAARCLAALGLEVAEHEHPVLGKTRLPGVPIRFAKGALALELPPFLGEHNGEIARDLGYAEPDIAGLERDGVLHSPPASATER